MNRAARLALRAYPPSFRDRYLGELHALLDDLPAGRSVALNLLGGAVQAWVRPAFTGAGCHRRRLQASAATAWVAWCAGFLIAPAINRALLDPPVRGTGARVRDLLDAGQVLFVLGWALALLGAAPIVARAVVPALRARSWPALRPLLPAIALGGVEAAGLIAFVATRGGSVTSPSDGFLAVGAAWLLGFAGFIVCLGLGPAVAVHRLRPPAETLRVAVVVSLGVALCLAALSACSVAAVVASGHASLLGSAIPVDAALAVACGASLVAVTSTARGIRAVRSA